MRTGWVIGTLLMVAGCDEAGTLPGGTGDTVSTDATVADTATAADTVNVEDTAVPADTMVPADTTVPEDTTVPADTTVPEDTTVADDTTESEVPVPGGPISFSAPPVGYSANKPAWVDGGNCTSAQWWTYEGTHESKNMHPGRDCVGCHDDENGPGIRYAGTVYAAVDDADECRGVGGVKVELLRADDTVAATTTTGAGGNFYWRTNQVPVLGEYRARLTFDGRIREMADLVTETSCNTCHTTTGAEDAPGRIVAP